ncbi:MAG: MATE family efflux transporter [Clostridia bacterium]|nr:MATE family efflux transporter [Clostridia bacterium]
MKRIQLSDHFTWKRILLFSLPSIGVQLVSNTYQVADGYFISNFINSSAFAAENLIFPPIAILASIGLMFGSGASALISQKIGEGKRQAANQLFTFTISVLLIAGILCSALLLLVLPYIAQLVGADEGLLPYCVEYGRILLICMPFLMLSCAFYPLMIVAERPGLGLAVSIINAVSNIVLDWLLIAELKLGMTGAALATGLSWIIRALISLVFFMNRSNPVHFEQIKTDWKAIAGICYNGASEMVDAISYSIIAVLFNLMLVKLAGENGVSAYAVTEYVTGIFTAVFFGIGMSITPVVGYHLGEKNLSEIKSLLKNGILLTGVIGIFMTLFSVVFAGSISRFFVGYNSELTSMSVEALNIVSLSFLITGITTFSSSYFTGLGDGTASLVISALKSFLIPLIGILLFSHLWGLRGIWIIPLVSEIIALVFAFIFIKHSRKKMIL